MWLVGRCTVVAKSFENDTNINFQSAASVCMMAICIYSRMLWRVIRWIAINSKVPLCHANEMNPQKTFPLHFSPATKGPANTCINERITAMMRRRLLEVGLVSRRAAKKPLLSRKNIRDRLILCKRYRELTADDWGKVIFSDESPFRLFGASRKKLVRRRQGERYHQSCVIPTASWDHSCVGLLLSQGSGLTHNFA